MSYKWIFLDYFQITDNLFCLCCFSFKKLIRQIINLKLFQIYLLKKKNKNPIKYILYKSINWKLYYKKSKWIFRKWIPEINRKSRMAIFNIRLRFSTKIIYKILHFKSKTFFYIFIFKQCYDSSQYYNSFFTILLRFYF